MLEQVWNLLLVVAAGVVTLAGAGGVIIAIYKWARKPDSVRDEKLKKHDGLLDNDNRRLKSLEEWRAEKNDSEKILMKSLLALMSHELDGNHTNDLKKARDDLQEYIIGR